MSCTAILRGPDNYQPEDRFISAASSRADLISTGLLYTFTAIGILVTVLSLATSLCYFSDQHNRERYVALYDPDNVFDDFLNRRDLSIRDSEGRIVFEGCGSSEPHER